MTPFVVHKDRYVKINNTYFLVIDPLDAKEHKDSLEEEGIKLEVNEVEAQDSAQIAYLEQIYNDLEDQDNYYDEDYVPIIEKSPKKLKKEKKEVIFNTFKIC